MWPWKRKPKTPFIEFTTTEIAGYGRVMVVSSVDGRGGEPMMSDRIAQTKAVLARESPGVVVFDLRHISQKKHITMRDHMKDHMMVRHNNGLYELLLSALRITDGEPTHRVRILALDRAAYIVESRLEFLGVLSCFGGRVYQDLEDALADRVVDRTED